MKIKYFGASWCEPCKNYWPIVESAVKNEFLSIEKHDVEEDSDIVATYGVRGVPTIVLSFDDGETIAIKQGVMSKAMLQNWIWDNFSYEVHK
jgi:thioredoxin 1